MTDNESTDEKYTFFIESAYKIFAEKGLKNVSMDDLCRIVGVSKKTLYLYFENKADLLSKIILYIRQLIESRVKQLETMNLNAIDVLLEMSKIASTRHFRINPMVTFELKKYYPQKYEEYMNSKKELIVTYIKKNIEKGITEGLYRQDLDKDIVARLYFQKIEDLHDPEFIGSEDFNYARVFEVMFENHIRGIANPKGIEYFEKQKEKLNFNI